MKKLSDCRTFIILRYAKPLGFQAASVLNRMGQNCSHLAQRITSYYESEGVKAPSLPAQEANLPQAVRLGVWFDLAADSIVRWLFRLGKANEFAGWSNRDLWRMRLAEFDFDDRFNLRYGMTRTLAIDPDLQESMMESYHWQLQTPWPSAYGGRRNPIRQILRRLGVLVSRIPQRQQERLAPQSSAPS